MLTLAGPAQTPHVSHQELVLREIDLVILECTAGLHLRAVAHDLATNQSLLT